jgi:hypothetical protein
MENERLLMVVDIANYCGVSKNCHYCVVNCDRIAKAQDAKSIAALIAQIESHRCEDCTMNDDVNGCTFADISCDWWESLKQSLEVK